MTMVHNGTINNPVTKKKAGFQITDTIRRSYFEIGGKFPGTLVGDDDFIITDTEIQLQ